MELLEDDHRAYSATESWKTSNPTQNCIVLQEQIDAQADEVEFFQIDGANEDALKSDTLLKVLVQCWPDVTDVASI